MAADRRQLLGELYAAMRHYPTAYDLAQSAKAAPAIWGAPK